MTTSGSSDFTINRDELCLAAARKVYAVRGSATTMPPKMLTDFTLALNAMVKHWQAQEIHVWTVSEATLFPQASQVRYALASSGAAHCTQDYAQTELSAAEAAGQTTISVDDDDDILDNDYVAIVLEDGTMHFSQVNGTPAGNVVTIDHALPSTAAAGAALFAYTSKIVRPLRIVDWRLHNIVSGQDTPMPAPIARYEYQGLPNKTAPGSINNLFYDPQLSTGYLSLWQPPRRVSQLVKFTWWRPIQDFDAAGDNPDFPTEWTQTLIFNLAKVVAPEFSVPNEKMIGPAGIATLADQYLDEMKGWGREAESVQFGIDIGR